MPSNVLVYTIRYILFVGVATAKASEKSKIAEVYAIAGSPTADDDATRGAAVQSAIAPPTYENADAHAGSYPKEQNEDRPPSYLALFSHN